MITLADRLKVAQSDHGPDCNCGNDHAPITVAAAKKYDPTKTTMIRKKFERDLVRRFTDLITIIQHEVADKNGFGLSANAKFGGRDPAKVDAFMKWLKEQERKGILEVTRGGGRTAGERAWYNVYIRSAYQKGLSSSAGEMRKGGVRVADEWVEKAFFRPIHADALGLIFTRSFSDLEGITSAMDSRISRTLAQGLADGLGAQELADEIEANVRGIGIHRARVLARTEVISAHAESTLNTYTEAGLEGVMIRSEFATARDNKVCPLCAELEGKVFTLDEARGIIPVHPNCRCAWIPVVENPEGIELR